MNTSNFIQIYETMKVLDFESSCGMTEDHRIVRNEKLDSYSQSYNHLMERLESIGVLDDSIIQLIQVLIKSTKDLEAYYTARSFELGKEIGLSTVIESINSNSRNIFLEKEAI